MSEQSSKELILSAIYIWVYPLQALIPMVIDQSKSALKGIDPDINEDFKALGLEILKEKENAKTRNYK